MNSTFEKISWQMILFLFLGIFFIRNLLLPIMADDFSYAFIWDGEHVGNLIDGLNPDNMQRVQSIGDIFISQWQHYFTWGGRTIAHVFVQFFILIGKIFFDIANVFVMLALIFLLFKIGTGLKIREMNKIYLLWILVGIYFCTPSFVITTIWLTGACNYLWMTVFELLFLLPFALKYWQKNFWNTPPKFAVPLMAILGLCAGWTIEPGGAVTVFVAFLFLIHFWRERKLETWMKVGFIFLAIGFAILVLAPGNFYRLELTNTLEPDDVVTPEQQWTFEMFEINFLIGFLPVLLREFILFLPIIYFLLKSDYQGDKTRNFVFGFSAASIIVLCVMMFSPEFPERAGYSSTICLLIASLASLKEILPNLKKFYQSKIILAEKFFAVALCASMLACVVVDIDLHNQIEERFKIIEQNLDKNLIVVPPLEVPAWSEIFLGSRTWDNMALYWGADLEADTRGARSLLFTKYYGYPHQVVTEDTEKN